MLGWYSEWMTDTFCPMAVPNSDGTHLLIFSHCGEQTCGGCHRPISYNSIIKNISVIPVIIFGSLRHRSFIWWWLTMLFLPLHQDHSNAGAHSKWPVHSLATHSEVSPFNTFASHPKRHWHSALSPNGIVARGRGYTCIGHTPEGPIPTVSSPSLPGSPCFRRKHIPL